MWKSVRVENPRNQTKSGKWISPRDWMQNRAGRIWTIMQVWRRGTVNIWRLNLF
jgi:hypothetical protein